MAVTGVACLTGFPRGEASEVDAVLLLCIHLPPEVETHQHILVGLSVRVGTQWRIPAHLPLAVETYQHNLVGLLPEHLSGLNLEVVAHH